jgi:polar amino acid transport system substrate-binding protein
VSDLKGFSRQERYDLRGEVDVNRVVESGVGLSMNLLKNATKRFRVEYGEGLPLVRGNFQRLEQVVINLLQNGCQALRSREEGIEVRTGYEEEGRRVVIRVRDEGVGIGEKELMKVKDPFFTTRREIGGTGLGLSISTTIVEDHGGRLEIESEPGRGTVATVSLPRER